MEKLEKVKNILHGHKLRVTQSRIAVATILIDQASSSLTPEEIFLLIEDSKDLSCDQVSVYRTLTTFYELGLVKKSVFQGEAARYSFVEKPKKSGQSHEHFFKCDLCSIVEPLKGCFVTRKEKELEKSGYRNLHHHVEITGLCPSCAQK